MPKRDVQLKKQFHIRKNELDFNSIKPVQNKEGYAKPDHGFWTATYMSDLEYGAHFNEVLNWTGKWHLIDPKEANIFVVEELEDVQFLLEHYGRRASKHDGITFVDFEKLSRDFDALQLTQQCFEEGSPVKTLELEGYGELDINNSALHPFYQWAGESTLWFNIKFNKYEIVDET
ncbi:hypothetical protein PCCS19_21000 [Paenibacillus sp. CCS19]|uniref:hypothetical protein n=1 Tax=Paenibacillus sp. CCS19 TaxID=3158387 RepID=UPI002565C509|nr:hypothetical protein [Paenibacillus cellulosilyticus]GMK39046.1 hypothetical protein PCCS19_21000 [Paenibacillus cellulosilyticus]